MRRALGLGLMVAGALVSGACGPSVPLGTAKGSAGVGGIGGVGGLSGAAGNSRATGLGGASLTDAGVGGMADAVSGGVCLTIPSWPTPDPFITNGAATASGSCSGETLQQAIDAVHSAHPELADIVRIFAPGAFLDGSFIYAFAAPTGFRLVFVRGGGDCPAGCTEHQYWYFQTDGSCTPVLVGNYHPDQGTGDGGCPMYGTPMWAVPPPPDPISVCGADNTPRDISGSYTLCVNGISYPCDAKGSSAGIPFHSVTMTVAQSAGDLAKGTVTLGGTGVQRLDGVALDAIFTRKRFSVSVQESDLPAQCLDQYSISLDVDFEGTSPPSLRFFESHAVGACPPMGDYCKGDTHF
jgi:hypothetical protein